VDPERWQKLRSIYEQALEMETSIRSAYLDEACGTDSALRTEVSSLLAINTETSFLEKPVQKAAPELFEPEQETISIGTRIGSCEIERRIGNGGMGVVYLGRDTRLDRQVAVKALVPFSAFDPQQKERFRIEARAAAKLSHPGIATVYSLEEKDGNLYLISEYIQGRTLREIISERSLSLPQSLDIAMQIAKALAAAHDQGIIHRDLKPENIMVTPSGAAKILDFGLARIESKGACQSAAYLTLNGQFLGTPAYSSPEQLLGNPVDRRSDLFSFGILLFELATFQHPFHASNAISTIARILEGEVPDLNQCNPAAPKELIPIVSRCLQKNPEDRYTRTQDLLDAMAHLPASKGTRPFPHSSALWWWQFHQACAGFGYYGMLYPLWRVKEWLGGVEGSLLFFPALIAVGIAANLRLHLWFTSRFYPMELEEHRRSVFRWIRRADSLFVFILALTAIRIHTLHAIIATLLMAVAIGALVAFSLIEPVTTRAALDRYSNANRR
jgi:serine/threonine-protein kinase